MEKNRILFYSSVKDPKLFKLTGFYIEDLKALKRAGFNVQATNNPFTFFLFWKFDIGFFYFYKKSFFPALITFLWSKKIFFTGGIDELSPLIEISKRNKMLFEMMFVLNYIIANRCNIVSYEDLKNTTTILKAFRINSPNKLIYFPHSIDLDRFNN
jgi:hypothetical protein